MYCKNIFHHSKMLIFSILLFVVAFSSCTDAESVSKKEIGKNNVAANQVKTKIVTDSSVKKDNLNSIPEQETNVIVYYFHGNARCQTCFKLENYARSEIEAAFSAELKKGKLIWKAVNTEENGNEHFMEHYKLYSKSVIISIQQDGKEIFWRNLEQIWEKIHSEKIYKDYIRNEVKACLNGKCL